MAAFPPHQSTTMKFRRKPVTVEAVQLTEQIVARYLFDKTPLPGGIKISSASYHQERRQVNNFSAYVTSSRKRIPVAQGDWVVRGEAGKPAVVTAEEFHQKYESIE